jgi:predicted component of type VI protein secretion system
MPKIFVLSGPDVGMSFEVTSGSKLGRAPECAVTLRHPSVSRHHATLELDGGSWWIVDLDSRNGLTVAGERVPRAPLVDGAEFQLGEVLMRLRLVAGEYTASNLTESGRSVYAPERVSVAPDDEIVLEGEWDPAAAAARPPARTPNPTILSTPSGSPSKAAPTGATPAPVPLVREESARERATAKLTAAGALPKSPTNARGVLQFNKVEARSGFMTSELGQQPWWIQFAVGLLAIALFVALIWLAFRGTVWFRSGANTPAVEETTPR